jgi:hypothetical protein
MPANKLNLTRSQLRAFLKDHESIKQFEKLFAVVDEIAPDFVNEVAIAAGSAQATALSAIAQIIAFSQDADVNSSTAYQKAIEALEGLASLKKYTEAGGVMPPRIQTQKNQEVLAWLSM